MKSFSELYAENMEKESIKNPGMYIVPRFGNKSITGKLLPSSWYELSLKMCLGIYNETANVSKIAKRTAGQMGYDKNISGVKDAILSDPLFGGVTL